MKANSMLALGLFMISLLVDSAYSQKVWEKKSYTNWTAAEVGRILLDSPWAQTLLETAHLAGNLPGTSYSATIRLRSALPIRQALVRRRQLAVNYENLSSTDRARFDAETREFLECTDCANFYIITLASRAFGGLPGVRLPNNTTTPGSYGVDITAPLKSLSLTDLKPYVHLINDSGEHREIVGFIPPAGEAGEAMFVFPRMDNQGKLMILPGDKKFHFKIDSEVFKKMAAPLKKFTFEVSRLVQNGEVIF